MKRLILIISLVLLTTILYSTNLNASKIKTAYLETEEPINPETEELKNLETQEPETQAIPTPYQTQNLSFPETITNYNFLKNSSFESFSEGQDKAPDSWNISKLKISRDKNNQKFDSYAAKLTYKRQEGSLSQTISEVNNLKAKTLTFGCWVKTDVLNQVRISLTEDDTVFAYSSYHTGSGDFEFLNLTATISDLATNLKVAINLDSKGTVYVDGACLYQLITEATYIPNPQDDLKMPSSLIYTDLTNQFVGIATDKPKLRLDVNGPLRIQNIWSVSPTLGEGLELLYDTSTQSGLIQAYDRANNSLKDLYLQNNQFLFGADGRLEVSGKIYSENNELLSQTSADDLYVNESGDNITGDLTIQGNVGIGTTSPNYKLDVDGNTKIGGNLNVTGYIYPGNGSTTQNERLVFDDGDFITISWPENIGPIARFGDGVYIDTDLSICPGLKVCDGAYNEFGTRTLYVDTDHEVVGIGTNRPNGVLEVSHDGSAHDLVVDQTSGNIGIGTKGPLAKLHVAGDLRVLSGADNTGGLRLEDFEFYKRIQSYDNEPLLINELGNNVIFNLSGGNVGIGTIDTGGYKLNVAGSLNATDFYRNGSLFNPTQWNTSTSGNDIYYNTGNVGIGTNSPQYKLSISGGSTANTNATVGVRMGWGTRVDVGMDAVALNDDIQTTPNIGLAFYTADAGGLTEKIRIDNKGNVGIGIPNPTAKLHMDGIFRKIYRTDTSAKDYIIGSGYELDGTSHAEGGYALYHRWGESGYGDGGWLMTFGTPGNPILSLYNGNVGIGILTPETAKLEVAGNARFSGDVGLNRDNPRLIFDPTGTFDTFDIIIDESGEVNGLSIRDTTTGLTLATFIDTGNVGIGKTDPNYKLDVNGDIRVTGNIISEGDICIGKCN